MRQMLTEYKLVIARLEKLAAKKNLNVMDLMRAGIRDEIRRCPANEIGVIVSRDNPGHIFPIEILSYIHGVKNDELQHPHYSNNLGNSNAIVKVPISVGY